MKLLVGLVHNWPGARNSELDIILRVIKILQALGHQYVIIDPMGQPLDANGNRTGESRLSSLDLVLNFHYLNPKFLDALSYTVNWNPLAYIIDDPITREPLPIKQYQYISDSFKSHDRILSAGSQVVDNHVNALRHDAASIDATKIELSLHTTIESQPELSSIVLSVEQAKVFYIGVNWEKLSQSKDKSIRHEGLFEVLDKSGEFAFYGLREQYGIPLWEGIASYCGELPFDGGDSILQKSREHGITLVLSSEQHRHSELVSTRIFQACAAGAVIISDRNVFIESEFGDNVFYFDYAATPALTAKNILAQVKAIKSDWQNSLCKAQRCRDFFESRFCLRQEIKKICIQAQNDLITREHNRKSVESIGVSVIYDWRSQDLGELAPCVNNLKTQSHKNIVLHILSDTSNHLYQKQAVAMLDKSGLDYLIEFYTHSLGQYVLDRQESLTSCLLLYSSGFVWSGDHLYLMCLEIEKGANSCYSPLFIEYQQLLNCHETMEFFIKGLDGGYTPLMSNDLERFDVTRFPTGNLLLRLDLLFARPETKLRLPLFDTGFSFVLAYESWKVHKKAPVNLPKITSRFVTSSRYGGFIFNQYENNHKLASLYRDRNAFAALYRGENEALTEQIHTWELEQQSGDLSFGYALESRLVAMRKELDCMQNDIYRGDFSTQFSIQKYWQHQLRNRPVLLNFFNGFFRFITKILKI